MSSNVNTHLKARSGNLASRRASGRRLATVLSASVAVLGFSAACGITSAAASPARPGAIRPCYVTGPQITVTSLRLLPSGRYLNWIDGSCFSAGATVSVRTAVRNLSGQPVETLAQSTTASAGGQFGVPLLGPSIIGMETVTAQDAADGLTSNPLTFDLPLPLYGPAVPVQ